MVAMNAIDLFSGCGGLTLGLKMAGFSVKAAIEIDKLAVETYRVNNPEVVVLNVDIRSVDVQHFMEHLQIVPGEIDLVAGCPPCRGFSSIRTLNGKRKVEDNRNNLLFDYLRFVRELRPKSIMFENVPGLMKEPIFS
ncbi:DNA cytosine methyltransferase [Mesotoga sp.]|uniref:DNA cytosine methyltransferase n=1 Tax=Mesotoga sp. TaxID=2053577 RepID=UPI001BD353D1|nr:DNA cytosine methyltransferase [Mesotoga sp.]